MGDFVTLLQHLNLSPVNTGLLAVICWLIYRLFAKFDALEGQCGVIQQIREHLAEHDKDIAVNGQRITSLEDKD